MTDQDKWEIIYEQVDAVLGLKGNHNDINEEDLITTEVDYDSIKDNLRFNKPKDKHKFTTYNSNDDEK